jgi:hypothetical protein
LKSNKTLIMNSLIIHLLLNFYYKFGAFTQLGFCGSDSLNEKNI